ncbi:MAG: hypothetical protein KGL35_05400 [Bradyrhizobium sp.]|nr:hypothetical protein [Bradyrhizobium sp.]
MDALDVRAGMQLGMDREGPHLSIPMPEQLDTITQPVSQLGIASRLAEGFKGVHGFLNGKAGGLHTPERYFALYPFLRP